MIGIAAFRVLVAMLDQEPISAPAAIAVMLHPYQHPFALQLLAKQCKFKVAVGETFSGVIGKPVTAVPNFHCAATILTLRNRAFEITVIERMILDFNRKPL